SGEKVALWVGELPGIGPAAPQREQLQPKALRRLFWLSCTRPSSYLDLERPDIASNSATTRNAVKKLIIAEHAIISKTVLASNNTERREPVMTNPIMLRAKRSSANTQCRRSTENLTP